MTKLQVFSTKQTDVTALYNMMTNPLTMDGEKVEFVETAEHMGIVRATLVTSQLLQQESPPIRKLLELSCIQVLLVDTEATQLPAFRS